MSYNSKTLFTKDECNEIINYGHNKGWTEGKYGGFAAVWVDLDWIYDKLYQYLIDEVGIQVKPTMFKYLNRYIIGQKNPLHHDQSPNPKTKNNTIITINTLLNNEFEGGDFILKNEKIKLEVGKPLHFSSKTLHQVTEITAGERYTLTCFVNVNDIIRNKNLL